MTADVLVDERVRALHDDYVQKVNAAVAQGRLDLVDALIRQYPEHAARVGARVAEPVA
jgi:hypothetical protein